ncbi:MAG TPA: hypothetical protein ENN74_03045 [Firmicutes bacterium]|nr:hypothetical protein [Bacillota bacterium]
MLVILACCAGLGMGVPGKGDPGGLTGFAAWRQYYGGSWAGQSLAKNVGAFVDGGANLVAAVGVPYKMAVGIIAVMVCCFAATTLDTATRLQRYVIQEIGTTVRCNTLRNKYLATTIAVVAGGFLALIPGPNGPGSGGLILWPLFGAVNQLLAGLAFLVVTFYLLRLGKPVAYVLLPAILMIVIPGWAMMSQIGGWLQEGKWLLFGFGVAVELLQIWLVLEAALMWKRARGVPPPPLPPLVRATAPAAEPSSEGGRAC